MATECRRLRAVLSSSACQTTLSLQTGHNSVAPSRFDGPLRRQLMTLLFLVGCCPSCGSDIRNYSSGAGMPRPPCRADRSNPMSKGPCRTHPALREGIRTTERLAQAWRCATPSYKGRHQCRRQGVATNAGDKGRSTRWLKGRRKRVGGGNADRALLVPPSLADELTPRGREVCRRVSVRARDAGQLAGTSHAELAWTRGRHGYVAALCCVLEPTGSSKPRASCPSRSRQSF